MASTRASERPIAAQAPFVHGFGVAAVYSTDDTTGGEVELLGVDAKQTDDPEEEALVHDRRSAAPPEGANGPHLARPGAQAGTLAISASDASVPPYVMLRHCSLVRRATR